MGAPLWREQISESLDEKGYRLARRPKKVIFCWRQTLSDKLRELTKSKSVCFIAGAFFEVWKPLVGNLADQ